MKKLIELDAAVSALDGLPMDYGRWDVDDVLHALASVPTVDAVEVVRCRVCRWWGVFPGSTAAPTYHDCKARGISTDADDFCKRGERKDGDNHDG